MSEVPAPVVEAVTGPAWQAGPVSEVPAPVVEAVTGPAWQAGPVSEVPAPVVEAARKAGVLWVAAPGARPYPAWTVWRDGATYLLTGPGEQPLPGLAEAAGCTVTARSADTGGRIATWRATVTRVDPATEEWAGVLPALRAARLNATVDPATATVLRLTPTELLPVG